MPEITDDELDRVLQAAGTSLTPRTAVLEEELTGLAVATESKAARGVARRPVRLAAAGALGLVLLGGTAAAASGLWAPWATTPDGVFTYVLPSGIQCEERVGDITAENPRVRAAVHEIFAGMDVVAAADVDKWRQRLERDPAYVDVAQQWVDEGTSDLHTVEDMIAQGAVSQAVMEVVDAELHERGFDPEAPENMTSIRGQWICGEGEK
jgi:hypothetical protein